MAPKKKNKQGKNGYWQFFLETRDKSTNKHMSQQELQDYANRKWVAMSKEARAPYEQRALFAKNTLSSGRCTSDGVEIDEIENQERLAAQKQVDMKNEIKRVLKAAHCAEALLDHMFFIVHMNQLVYVPAEESYYLCEVAISVFNLRSGVRDVFWMDVKPGKLPLGFYGPAKTISKETHQMLELAQEEPYEDNTQQVFSEMIKFLRKYKSRHDSYTIYAKETNMPVVSNVIDRFCRQFNFNEDIKVHSLEYMFFVLKNTTAEQQFWPTESYSVDLIDKDAFCYTLDIACDFHNLGDISAYCSKSIVTRYAYTICDHCCADVDIQLNPGSHVPKGSKINYRVKSLPASEATSVYSNDDYQQDLRRRRRDSFGSTDYDENFPPVGSYRSAGRSVDSFSTLGEQKPRSGGATKAATRIEQSFQAISLNESRRDRANLQLPKHGHSSKR